MICEHIYYIVYLKESFLDQCAAEMKSSHYICHPNILVPCLIFTQKKSKFFNKIIYMLFSKFSNTKFPHKTKENA